VAKPKVAKPAATSDIVGQASRPERIPTKWQKHFARLKTLRDQLLNRQAVLAKDALDQQPTFSSHMADAGTDTYDRDFALGMLSSEQDSVYEVEQAVNRIRDGSYGICEMTGKPIDPARLEAIPWTRFSAAAERELEKEGAVKRPRLGPRESVSRGEAVSEEETEEE
jgi:RNA polymerase-binding transcription factor DksA